MMNKRLLSTTVVSFCLLVGSVSMGMTEEIRDALTASKQELENYDSVLPEQDVYRVGPGNVLQIKIYGEAGLNQTYRVDELGYITHALVGRLKIAGLSLQQIERLMEDSLSGDYILNPQVTVFIIEHSRFSVLGEVRRPGTYELQGTVTLIEAISMAGGFSPVADQRKVRINRKTDAGERALTIDTIKITQQGDFTSDEMIQADDVIVIPKSFF